MHYTYQTNGTCSTRIDFDIKENKIYNLQFTGGCNGNSKGISILVEGQDVDKIKNKLQGIKCSFRNTSCPDQLAKALEEIK